MNRYFSSFLLTSFLYVSFFGFFGFVLANSLKTIQKDEQKLEKIKFCMVTPKPKEIIPHEIKPEPKPLPKPEPKIEKKIEPKPKSLPKPEPKVKPKIEKKEVVLAQPVVELKPKPQVVVKPQVDEQELFRQKQKQLEEENRKKLLAIKKQQMLDNIRALIDKNKSYPRFARKANIEGVIKITFTISPEGNLVSYSIIEGKKVFHSSIENAIKNSFPYPIEKDVVTSNLTINLDIVYKLI